MGISHACQTRVRGIYITAGRRRSLHATQTLASLTPLVRSDVNIRNQRRQDCVEQPRVRGPLRNVAVWGDDGPDVPRPGHGSGPHAVAEAAGICGLVSCVHSDCWPILTRGCSAIEAVHTVTLACFGDPACPNILLGLTVGLLALPHGHRVRLVVRHPRGPLVLRSFLRNVCTRCRACSRALRFDPRRLSSG
jgi:hypothetical protein